MNVKRQQGAGFLFFIFFMFLLSFFLYVTWLLVPVYLENYAVKQALGAMPTKNVIISGQSREYNKEMIRRFLGKMYRVNSVTSVSYSDFDLKKNGNLYNVVVDYEVRKHLIYNVDIVVKFAESVEVQGA